MEKYIEGALSVKNINRINLGEVKIFGKSVEKSEAQKQTNSPNQNEEKLAGNLLVFLVFLSELFIYFGKFKVAILFYAVILTGLSLTSIFVKKTEVREMCQIFLLLPILRLINFSIPAFSENLILSFIFIYAPMILPILIIIDSKQLTFKEIGINFENIWYYIPASIFIGLIAGLGEYFTVEITPPFQDFSFINLLILIFVMLPFVGVVEEIIFRSFIQTKFEKTFGILDGLILSSLVFGLMHAGFGNIYEILYMFLVGLLIGFIFQKTRSLPFVAMIHGFINVFFLGIIPYWHTLGLL